jgi:site-specific DNA-methyltransferase (adenine-specific)
MPNEAKEQSRQKVRAPRNRTITLSEEETKLLARRLVRLNHPVTITQLENRIVNQDLGEVLEWLPANFADLVFIDPPYNLTKSFNGIVFKERTYEEYSEWVESWLPTVVKTLKPDGSLYICGDWRSSSTIQSVAQKYLVVQNRITWEREKGRGARANWKNSTEDVWFCTKSDHYTFNVDAVKVKRRVIAPYTDSNGEPKDWNRNQDGDYRLTHPSNCWTDLTVPFWSMPENTDHPTQKPEKLVAKIVLASSDAGDMVFDPFLGSGTSAVVAKKLGRKYFGVEVDREYCIFAEKRLALADSDRTIQGYADGIFWERNSMLKLTAAPKDLQTDLFLPLMDLETKNQTE